MTINENYENVNVYVNEQLELKNFSNTIENLQYDYEFYNNNILNHQNNLQFLYQQFNNFSYSFSSFENELKYWRKKKKFWYKRKDYNQESICDDNIYYFEEQIKMNQMNINILNDQINNCQNCIYSETEYLNQINFSINYKNLAFQTAEISKEKINKKLKFKNVLSNLKSYFNKKFNYSYNDMKKDIVGLIFEKFIKSIDEKNKKNIINELKDKSEIKSVVKYLIDETINIFKLERKKKKKIRKIKNKKERNIEIENQINENKNEDIQEDNNNSKIVLLNKKITEDTPKIRKKKKKKKKSKKSNKKDDDLIFLNSEIIKVEKEKEELETTRQEEEIKKVTEIVKDIKIKSDENIKPSESINSNNSDLSESTVSEDSNSSDEECIKFSKQYNNSYHGFYNNILKSRALFAKNMLIAKDLFTENNKYFSYNNEKIYERVVLIPSLFWNEEIIYTDKKITNEKILIRICNFDTMFYYNNVFRKNFSNIKNDKKNNILLFILGPEDHDINRLPKLFISLPEEVKNMDKNEMEFMYFDKSIIENEFFNIDIILNVNKSDTKFKSITNNKIYKNVNYIKSYNFKEDTSLWNKLMSCDVLIHSIKLTKFYKEEVIDSIIKNKTELLIKYSKLLDLQYKFKGVESAKSEIVCKLKDTDNLINKFYENLNLYMSKYTEITSNYRVVKTLYEARYSMFNTYVLKGIINIDKISKEVKNKIDNLFDTLKFIVDNPFNDNIESKCEQLNVKLINEYYSKCIEDESIKICAKQLEITVNIMLTIIYRLRKECIEKNSIDFIQNFKYVCHNSISNKFFKSIEEMVLIRFSKYMIALRNNEHIKFNEEMFNLNVKNQTYKLEKINKVLKYKQLLKTNKEEFLDKISNKHDSEDFLIENIYKNMSEEQVGILLKKVNFLNDKLRKQLKINQNKYFEVNKKLEYYSYFENNKVKTKCIIKIPTSFWKKFYHNDIEFEPLLKPNNINNIITFTNMDTMLKKSQFSDKINYLHDFDINNYKDKQMLNIVLGCHNLNFYSCVSLATVLPEDVLNIPKNYFHKIKLRNKDFKKEFISLELIFDSNRKNHNKVNRKSVSDYRVQLPNDEKYYKNYEYSYVIDENKSNLLYEIVKCEDKYGILHSYDWYSNKIYQKFQMIVWTLLEKYLKIIKNKNNNLFDIKILRREIVFKINLFSKLLDDKYNKMIIIKTRMLSFRICLTEIYRTFNKFDCDIGLETLLRKLIDIIKNPFNKESIKNMKSIKILSQENLLNNNGTAYSLFNEYYLRTVIENMIETVEYNYNVLSDNIKNERYDYEKQYFKENASLYSEEIKDNTLKYWNLQLL